jgi:hypothetical protein
MKPQFIATVILLGSSVVGSHDAVAKEESRTVSAHMGGGSGSGVGIRATPRPGRFTVPEGHVATGFKYHFHDPATSYTSTRLGPSNIYSETLGRSIREAQANPNIELPPGKYKFVVGGRPGASGTLSFKIVSTTADPREERPIPDNLRLPTNFDVTYDFLTDIYYTHEGTKRQLDEFDTMHEWVHPEQVVVRFRNGQVSSQYKMVYPPSVEALKGTDTHTLAGTLANGRFAGTETVDSNYQLSLRNGQVLNRRYGIVYALRGQVNADGKLIIHGKWQSDYGYEETLALNERGGTISLGNGRFQVEKKTYESHSTVKAGISEVHLQLPIGRSPTSQTVVQDSDHSGSTSSVGPDPPAGSGDQVSSGPPGNTVWDTPDDDPPWEPPATPPVNRDPRDGPGSGNDNIWKDADPTDNPIADSNTQDDEWDIDQETPKPADRLADGKILFKPPWDEGDPYPMSEEEVKEIQDKQRQGFRWDKRHGWVNDKRQKDIDVIADIQRRNDEKEKQRSDDNAKKLADSERRSQTLAEKEKRRDDEALAEKVKSQGFGSLTKEERKQLSEADDDIKDDLRGKPEKIRGYKRGIVDKTLPQGTIDSIHKGLDWTKTGIDEGMDFMKSKAGPAGELIGTGYTVGSKVLGRISEANAKYNAGTSDRPDYGKAAIEGGRDAATSIIIDKIGGKANDKLTDKLLDSKVGKKVIERAGKKKPDLIDDVTDTLTDSTKQNVNYGIGRTSKPGYDATLTEPVKNAVDWTTGNEDTTSKPDHK